MVGFLLARAGVPVVVLEKHVDFLRDFRGDTLHPSTLEVMHELGLLDALLRRPHQQARRVSGFINGVEVPVADFTHLPTHCGFMAFMPQWDFLDFLAQEARRFPGFSLRMQAEASELLTESGAAVGVRAQTPDGGLEIRSDLVIAADGRRSIIRECANLPIENIGSPIDVLWMRIARDQSDPDQLLGRFERGRVFVMIYRGDYWQCGYVIPKGALPQIQARGIVALRDEIHGMAPFLGDRIDSLVDWNDVKLLKVTVDRLRRWHCPGLLCIGDAAHAMSPVGGVGINLAIQDAIAAANILWKPLRHGHVTDHDLRRVQRRRQWPTRATQFAQVLVQDRILAPGFSAPPAPGLPWPARLLQHYPLLRRIPARLIGLGVRPEHVRSPAAQST